MDHLNYILLLVLAAVGYSFSRFIRNYMVDTLFNSKTLPSLIFGTAGTHIILMILLFALRGFGVFNIPFWSMVMMFIAGLLNTFSQFPSFKAMRIAETVELTIFSQVAPILALVFGFILLGQSINGQHLLGFVLIMIAAIILVFSEKSKSTQKSKIKTAKYVILSSALFVLSDIVLLAGIGKNYQSFDIFNFIPYFFFFQLGSFAVGATLFILKPSWRKPFLKVFFSGRKSSKNFIYLLVNNFSYAAAETLYKLALITAPAVALLAVVNQVSQLIVTFCLGITLSIFFPKFGREKLSKHILIRHLIAAVFVGMGIVLVS